MRGADGQEQALPPVMHRAQLGGAKRSWNHLRDHQPIPSYFFGHALMMATAGEWSIARARS